ncbi:MAG: ribosome recycling factor [Spiroplasma poulsonii]|uniref:Ribosome-recycling factor n=1 Tax=Spiroplasma poulsonii TaxID=2138 RepID=A0A2P6FFI4_9MOLU|nr:ribosome recycling factor [Spiroplasma poulsonii]KAF0850239.1 Ribosome-recycling factor [Spiroplasma poulsonii]MBW1241907.1 ribosome recycling factor [Spiroplasma poulsonii]PQM32124.1 Ribosome-recycling factor [Spiroplasma poulsonii]PWF94770.1 Ribosome-recycling factor [Spiroplasma poulsonii]PWF97568.1 Ribosome-recycling factor [Spiroplasma poulsonii]
MSQEIINQTKEKMTKVLESFENELVKIRTGRANPNMLAHIMIDYYGTLTPIQQLANIMVPEARQLVIKPYDRGTISLIVTAINKSDLGLSPNSEADLIRLNIPALTEERRKILVKDMWKEVEHFKIAVRNERRDSNEQIKKDANLTDDDKKYYEGEIQKLTDNFIKKLYEKGTLKEKELMEV